MLRASLFTLGCKLNQFETAYMAHILEGLGYTLVPFPSEADLYLINTCTVTSKSEHHSRNAVRKAIRANPRGWVLVTGCAAQVNPEGFAAIPGVTLVIGNTEKAHLPEFIDSLKNRERPKIHISDWGKRRIPLAPMAISRFVDYTRAFIKVQEGCDARCTYCIVPEARGPARSAPMDDILRQADALWQAGYREIVLTGIHLGQYGKDMRPRRHLHELLEGLLTNIGWNRIRLSSIEPNEFSPELFKLMGTATRLCPHFHVPLQSGSGPVLRRMGRQYTPEEYRDVVCRIYEQNPSVAIGVDVMVGFPGETEKDFDRGVQFLESLPVAYLHVFSFSPRPGTPAARFPDPVDAWIKKARSRQMRLLGRQKRRVFRSRFIGKELEALVLNQAGPKPGYRVALTGNYIPVFVEAGEDRVNHMVMVRVLKVDKNEAWGSVISVLN